MEPALDPAFYSAIASLRPLSHGHEPTRTFVGIPFDHLFFAGFHMTIACSTILPTTTRTLRDFDEVWFMVPGHRVFRRRPFPSFFVCEELRREGIIDWHPPGIPPGFMSGQSNSLVVTYDPFELIGCLYALGCPLPTNLVGLFVELWASYWPKNKPNSTEFRSACGDFICDPRYSDDMADRLWTDPRSSFRSHQGIYYAILSDMADIFQATTNLLFPNGSLERAIHHGRLVMNLMSGAVQPNWNRNQQVYTGHRTPAFASLFAA